MALGAPVGRHGGLFKALMSSASQRSQMGVFVLVGVLGAAWLIFSA